MKLVFEINDCTRPEVERQLKLWAWRAKEKWTIDATGRHYWHPLVEIGLDPESNILTLLTKLGNCITSSVRVVESPQIALEATRSECL